MSSAGMAGRFGVAVDRHSRRARLESEVVHDSAVVELEGCVGTA